MTGLSQNVEDLLKRLETGSKSELNLIRALAEAIRQVDDQTLRELRNLSLHHELRRETILGELQVLAQRMCHLPSRPASSVKSTIDRPAFAKNDAVTDVADEITEALNGNALNASANGSTTSHGADWRQAARNIQDDLDLAFGAAPPRH
jgi:hypothetical protein